MKHTAICLASLVCITASSGWCESPPQFLLKWGEMIGGQFHHPRGLTVGQNGDIFVSDTENHRIQRFDASGAFVAFWGIYGSGPGRLGSPRGLATAADGSVYISDHSKVQKFDASGNYLTSWFGSPAGNFQGANDVAVDDSGCVYVADTGSHRIQKFDAIGNFIRTWGEQGSENGQFDLPQGVAVGSSGQILIADSGNHRIQVFDASGTYIDQWGELGTGNGQFNNPIGIAVDQSGNVFVVDSGNARVQMFDTLGTFLVTWGSPGSAAGQFSAPTAIDVNSAGDVLVCDLFNDRVQKFTSGGVHLLSLGATLNDGQFRRVEDITIGTNGMLYVTDSDRNLIQMFTASGVFFGKWGSQGVGAGQFNAPRGIVGSSSGRVYVVDAGNRRVQGFDANGDFEFQWGSLGSGSGQFNEPNGVAVDGNGNVYIADSGNHRIQKFNAFGSFLTQWGSLGMGSGQFEYPTDVAVDGDDNVWVLDFHRVQRFDTQGGFIAEYAFPHVGSSAFGIAVDPRGDIYLSQFTGGISGVAKLDSGWTLLAEWGSFGGAEGEFATPLNGLAIDPSGNVYATDQGNHRVQKFGFTEEPVIADVRDIGNDQGRKVRLALQRSSHDAAGTTTPILQYIVFRRIDSFSMFGVPVVSKGVISRESRVRAARDAGVVADLAILDAGWDFVGLHPAFGQTDYNVVVPTLVDSTVVDGMQWSVFFVRAATANPLVFFDSVPDSGYSADNLAPGVPQGFMASVQGADVHLQWQPSADVDFRYFSLYRSTDLNFAPGDENRLAGVTAASYTDPGAASSVWYYKISAADFSGNESNYAVAGLTVSDIEPHNGVPLSFDVRLRTRHPVDEGVAVDFDLPITTRVCQRAFDVKGRVIFAVPERHMEAGTYSTTWDLHDRRGHRVPGGVYFWRVETSESTRTLRLVVLR